MDDKSESTRSAALKKAQQKYKEKTKAKQKYWNYKGYARKFLNEMATEDDLQQMAELIKRRLS